MGKEQWFLVLENFYLTRKGREEKKSKMVWINEKPYRFGCIVFQCEIGVFT